MTSTLACARPFQVRPLKPNEDPMNTTQIFVIVVSISTVVMWCLNSWICEVPPWPVSS